jgi:hypothetical protein
MCDILEINTISMLICLLARAEPEKQGDVGAAAHRSRVSGEDSSP